MRISGNLRIQAAVMTILLLLGLNGWAVDVNATLADVNATRLASMLKQVQKSTVQNENSRLQAALLSKLIQFEREPVTTPIAVTPPADAKAYGALFNEAIGWAEQVADLERRHTALLEKQQVIAKQLLALKRTDAKAFELQLASAYVTKTLRRLKKKRQAFKQALDALPAVLTTAINNVGFDTVKSLSALDAIDKALKQIDAALGEIELERDRLALLEKATDAVDAKIAALMLKRKALFRQRLNTQLMLFSEALKRKAAEEVFRYQSEADQTIEQLFDDAVSSRLLQRLVQAMEKEVMGTAAILTGKTSEGIKTIAIALWEQLNQPLFSLGDNPVSIFKIIIALLVLSLGFLLGGAYKRQIKRIGTTGKAALSASSRTLLANVGHYVIIVIAFFATLKVLGIDLSSVAIVAGALSVGIGFGLQNIVSNFVSGLIIMLEKSIRIGDYIEFDETLRGRVSDIRMRSTTVTTNANIDIIVPNQDLIQNRVINWTMNDDIRRFEIPFGVAYGSDVHKVIEVVLSAVNDSGFEDIYTTRERHARVIMTGMGDSSVDFELLVWIRGHETLYPKRTASRFLVLIYDALYKAGIEIPFPQRDLHLKSSHAPISVRIERD